MLTLPSHYGKSVVFPCVRLRVVALATTRAIHILNVELLYPPVPIRRMRPPRISVSGECASR